MKAAMLRRPSAFVPPALSLVALLIVGVHVALHGPAREVDEETAARLWQLAMVAQVPFIGFFLIKWLPSSPRAALPVVALQAGAAFAALAPVWFLHL